MTHMICQTFYYFFNILDTMLFLYILSSWFPNAKIRYHLAKFLDPLFTPIRYCLAHSVFRTGRGDLTPMIALVVLSYLQTFFYSMI